MSGITITLIFCLAIFTCQGASDVCKEKTARYAIPGQCDAYIECRNGVSEEKLCPDGLLFNADVDILTYPCQYPIDVDCGSRAKLQPAQATEECPHQFGFYRMGDSTHCSQFMNCAHGKGFTIDCPEGLAFDEESYRCDWPDLVKSCDAEKFLGFNCPPEHNVPGLGEQEQRFFKDPNSCQHYFACMDGRPRKYTCEQGHSFNELSNVCEVAENVNC